MLYKTIVIAKNTFVETLRQPVYAVILTAALIMYILSPSLTMYTMDDDNKLLREIGLSTLFLAGLFISVFAAASALTEEIETHTAITVLSKPVRRLTFILGKFLGIAAAVILAHYLLTIAHMLAMRHGVLETASDTHDWTVIAFAILSILASVIISAFFNYSYDWKFTSSAVVLLTIFATITITILAFIDRDWKFSPANNNFSAFDIYASLLLLQAVLILVILAIMFSTRLNVVMTLSCCIAIFLLGLISDYVFGRLAAEHIWAKIGRVLVPNFQIFWISDAIYEGTKIPPAYIFISTSYSAMYILAILLLAIALFQRRQIG